jgi:hypothetical protein
MKVKKRWCKREDRGNTYAVQLKSKAVQLQVWTGPEVPRMLRLLDFKTMGA